MPCFQQVITHGIIIALIPYFDSVKNSRKIEKREREREDKPYFDLCSSDKSLSDPAPNLGSVFFPLGMRRQK